MTLPRELISRVEGLSNARRALGDGSLNGLVRSATPHVPRSPVDQQVASSPLSLEARVNIEWVWLTATGQTIPDGGGYVTWDTEILDPARIGYVGYGTLPTDTITLPLTGLYGMPYAQETDNPVGLPQREIDGTKYESMLDQVMGTPPTDTVWGPFPWFAPFQRGQQLKVWVPNATGGAVTINAAIQLPVWERQISTSPEQETGPSIDDTMQVDDYNHNQVYDSVADSWSAVTAAPTSQRLQAAAFLPATKLVHHVGHDDYSGLHQAYDPATDTWTVKASMNNGRRELGSFVIGGLLYAAGGEAVTHHESYDPDTDSWTTLTSMPATIQNGGEFVLSGLGYVTEGGGNTYAYDPAADTWTAKANNPRPGDHLAQGVLGTLGVVADQKGMTYDPDTDSWTTGATFSGLIGDGTTGRPLGDLLYTVAEEAGTAAWDPDTDTWTAKANRPAFASRPHAGSWPSDDL